MKKIATIVIAILLIVLSLTFYVNTSFVKVRPAPFFNDCFKVWGHAGYAKDYQTNSLPGIAQAFDLGAKGVELDIHFDVESGRFIVSHDYPYKLKDGRLLLLEEVFDQSGNGGYFWLDFKNLKRLKKRDAKTATAVLLSMLERYNLLEKVIVESKGARNLSVFSRAGIHTSYWINVNRNKEGFETALRVFSFKIMFLYGGFSAFSIDHRNYTPYVQRTLKHLPVHLFTINNEEEVLEYLNKKNVKVILSDENLFSLDGCNGF